MAPDLVDLYIEAMRYLPSIREGRVKVWRQDASENDFTAVAAFKDDKLAGVAYGFRGNPDRWWDQQLRRGLSQNQTARREMHGIVNNYFELAEIHVAPSQQGQGIGRELIERLLADAPQPYVLLSTPEVPQERNAAFGLYRSLGFADVLREFRYDGDVRPFALLGRALPL